MSIHKRGNKWQVKWRQGDRQRSRTFLRKGDAITFETDIRRRKQLGPTLLNELDRSEQTLAQFVSGGWRVHAANLSAASRATYAWALEKHLAELLDEPLVSLDVPTLASHQRLLLERGATPTTVREVMIRLSGIMQISVEHGLIPGNPVRSLRKPRIEAGEEITPMTPIELERLITSLEGRDRAIALLGGHLGLRPGEIRSVPWSVLSDRALNIGRKHTKATARRPRTIAVPEVTARELKEWRLRSGRPDLSLPIIGPLSENGMKLWGAKRLRPAVAAATKGRITDATVYTLRHTHASALHYASFTVPEAARRLGHGGETHIRVYAHVIEAISGQRWPDLDALIASARADLMFPKRSPTASDGHPE